MLRSLTLGTVFSLLTASALAGMPMDTSAFATWQFALSLGSTSDGQLFSLFLVKVSDDERVLETEPITRLNFIRQVQGRSFSKANPEGEDLFRKFGVTQCTLPSDSVQMGFLTDCSALNDLWRLKFQSFPLKLEEGMHEMLGWAAKPLRPDDRQLLLLSGYGMKYTLDLVIGENMFRLLRDMGDPEWVDNYRGGY
ncbi:MAG: hypothetical protein IPP33_11430 [Flavobacteriales bacterium]|nr:hypothetical protein [Flavobacteriales bacterium]